MTQSRPNYDEALDRAVMHLNKGGIMSGDWATGEARMAQAWLAYAEHVRPVVLGNTMVGNTMVGAKRDEPDVGS